MPITLEYYLIGVAILLVLSVFASKLSDRFGIPALLVFLVIGMLSGSDGPGGIYFDDPAVAQYIGVVALIIILYSGGLDTFWRGVRPVVRDGLILATAGVLLTGLVVGIFARFIFEFSWLEGLLVGAIVSSTDAAAVFSILRSGGIQLKEKLKSVLELESGSNDPMAVFLTIGMIQLILNPGQPPLTLVLMFFTQMILGGILGYLSGKATLFQINRLKLGYEGLYPALTIGMVILTYGLTSLLGGSGFLAVYVSGLVTGRDDFVHKRRILRFYDGLAWIMQITMFLALGLLVFPSQLLPIILPGLGIALALMFIARPISVMISLLFSRYNLAEKAFISWVGLRGAVPIVLATYPRLAGITQSNLIFNVVFFVVLTSILFQGTSIPTIARRLKVDAPGSTQRQYPIEFIPDRGWKGALREINIPARSWVVGKAIYEIGLPADYLVVLIARGEEFIVPNGSIVLATGDILLGLAENEAHRKVESLIGNSTPPNHNSKTA